ncbi:hypothetical protein MTBBW1_60046 [Desulfamplus magnetovallimortis]|uniref:Phosphate-selective porin O and P n=1 Tax=Desulfamplus magnetovallimortis TaxID=1246637 RepID=A0A1W1HI69_9BACT|nr:hypothetical protein MTBBW1_60046 [Desulfamplus magnetovallimortis]
MGYYLSPGRDVGIMGYTSLFKERLYFSAGLFNGDGDDGSARGNEHDEPEVAARVVVVPFKMVNNRWLESLHLGCSGTFVKADNLNIDLRVKSSGMAGTSRNIYELTHNTKFGVIENVDDRIRTGIEAAWASGPFALQAEKRWFTYSGLDPAGSTPKSDAEFSNWYLSAALALTGETHYFSNGLLKSIYPNSFFNPSENTWGAFVLALRMDHFSGDEDWINPASHVSVKEADAFSIAMNWIMFPMCRIVADYSFTDFSDKIKVRVLPDGSTDYIDKENCLTLRLAMDF